MKYMSSFHLLGSIRFGRTVSFGSDESIFSGAGARGSGGGGAGWRLSGCSWGRRGGKILEKEGGIVDFLFWIFLFFVEVLVRGFVDALWSIECMGNG